MSFKGLEDLAIEGYWEDGTVFKKTTGKGLAWGVIRTTDLEERLTALIKQAEVRKRRIDKHLAQTNHDDIGCSKCSERIDSNYTMPSEEEEILVYKRLRDSLKGNEVEK